MSQEKHKLSEVAGEIGMAAALMGVDLAPEMARAFARQLKNMGASSVEIIQAARIVAAEEDGRLTLKKLLSRIPRLQYPDAETAWATFPRDEKQTGCVVEPALKAWGQAAPLWYDGDKIGARMAFKAAYEQFVAEAKQGGQATPVWTFTFGSDPVEREEKVREAVASGLVQLEKAKTALPHLTEEELSDPALPAPRGDVALLEVAVKKKEEMPEADKQVALQNLARLKAMIGGVRSEEVVG